MRPRLAAISSRSTRRLGKKFGAFEPTAPLLHCGIGLLGRRSSPPQPDPVQRRPVSFALDPKTGKSIAKFGSSGKVETGRVSVAGAIYRNVFVVPEATKMSLDTTCLAGSILDVPQPSLSRVNTATRRGARLKVALTAGWHGHGRAAAGSLMSPLHRPIQTSPVLVILAEISLRIPSLPLML